VQTRRSKSMPPHGCGSACMQSAARLSLLDERKTAVSVLVRGQATARLERRLRLYVESFWISPSQKRSRKLTVKFGALVVTYVTPATESLDRIQWSIELIDAPETASRVHS